MYSFNSLSQNIFEKFVSINDDFSYFISRRKKAATFCLIWWKSFECIRIIHEKVGQQKHFLLLHGIYFLNRRFSFSCWTTPVVMFNKCLVNVMLLVMNFFMKCYYSSPYLNKKLKCIIHTIPRLATTTITNNARIRKFILAINNFKYNTPKSNICGEVQ